MEDLDGFEWSLSWDEILQGNNKANFDSLFVGTDFEPKDDSGMERARGNDDDSNKRCRKEDKFCRGCHKFFLQEEFVSGHRVFSTCQLCRCRSKNSKRSRKQKQTQSVEKSVDSTAIAGRSWEWSSLPHVIFFASLPRSAFFKDETRVHETLYCCRTLSCVAIHRIDDQSVSGFFGLPINISESIFV